MIHSYSSISTYHDSCPRQFYERYVSKTAPFIDTPETLAGKRDHKALENRLLHDTPLPEHLTQCEPVCAAIDARGIAQLEVRMAVKDDLTETTFFARDAWCRGVLDVLLCQKDFSSAFIADWKTGKNREAGKEPLQLMLSAGYVFSYYPEMQSISAVNIYTKTGQMGAPHTWTRAELPTIWRTIVPLVQEIENALPGGAAAFPERPSGLCGYCPVLTCQHNRS